MNHCALIIDDDPGNLDVLEQLLIREGVESVSVRSPRAVASALDEMAQVDLIFLDLEFTDGDGLHFITELQSDERLPDVPIVAYTVHHSEQNEAREAGFHSFLGKPLDIDRFPDQLRRILDGEHIWEIAQ